MISPTFFLERTSQTPDNHEEKKWVDEFMQNNNYQNQWVCVGALLRKLFGGSGIVAATGTGNY